MPVYFANKGLIDLDVIRVMGVSVKENDSPIGYFGTGLKFAIATLLRTGHRIELLCGEDTYTFETRDTSIRGQEFKRCYMNEEPLPFTTELGRNWEVWQAYRELHSNTLDEDGQVSDKPLEGDTVFKVIGSAFQNEYHNRHKIFVAGTPLYSDSSIEIYSGESSAVYYRGVLAGRLPKTSRFIYNILEQMELTEDRTFKSAWDVEYKIEKNVPRADNEEIAFGLIEGGEFYEAGLTYTYCAEPSKEFVNVAERLYADTRSNSSAKTIVEKKRQSKADFQVATVSDTQQQVLLDAFELSMLMGASLSPEDVEVVETLGPSVMAIYHKGKDRVFIAKSTLDMGVTYVAATLYEEWAHRQLRMVDATRTFQDHLLQRLAALATELKNGKS